jgi:30S ribosomal protein S31
LNQDCIDEDFDMGKGDRKTAKGKRYNSSYGNARPASVKTASAPAAKRTVAKPAAKAAPVAKKAVAKKAVKE